MASAEHAEVTCPVCKRTDQVKTAQSAYSAGVARCAPPDMPTRSVSMVPYMLGAAIIIGICIFLVIVLVGGVGQGMGDGFLLGLSVVTIVCIISALVASFMAFQRVARGDIETTVRFPAWDRAMAQWRTLYYCSRDDVVFDSDTHKIISNDQLNTLRHASERVEATQAAVAH